MGLFFFLIFSFPKGRLSVGRQLFSFDKRRFIPAKINLIVDKEDQLESFVPREDIKEQNTAFDVDIYYIVNLILEISE